MYANDMVRGYSIKRESEVAKNDWRSVMLYIHASSTWREPGVIKLVLDSLSNELEGRSFIHRSDN